jgi:hypothetical protein
MKPHTEPGEGGKNLHRCREEDQMTELKVMRNHMYLCLPGIH